MAGCRRLLTWTIDQDARQQLEDEIFGKRVLVTNRDTWPIAEIVAAHRSQSDAEFGFRQLKDPHAVSFSPINHWTDQAIRVHTYTCVLALQLAHLMRRQASHAGLPMSVRVLLDTLAGIQETVLIYPSTGGRPKPAACSPKPPPNRTNYSKYSTCIDGHHGLRGHP